MAELYSNVGTTFRYEGNLRESARFYQKSLLIDREFNQGECVLVSLHNLGSVWLELSEFDTATEYFGEALEIAREHRLAEHEADILYRLGHTYRHLFQYTESSQFFDAGLRTAEAIQNLYLMTLNILGLGSLYEDIGEYKQALNCYDDALSGSQRLEDPTLQVETLTRIAALKLHIGCIDESRELAGVAHGLIPDDLHSKIRFDLDLLRSEIYYSRGMKEKSVVLINGILKSASHPSNGNGHVRAKIQQAIMELDRNRVRKALEIMSSPEVSADSLCPPSTEIEKMIIMGRIYRGMQMNEEALAVRENAVVKAEETRIPRLIWTTHHQLGRIFDDQQRYQLARNEYERAESLVYRTVMGLDQNLRKVFLDHRDRQALYQDYILVLFKLGHKEQALRILHRVASDNLTRKLKHLLND